MAIYDIGYPKDANEFRDLNGYALLLVAAVSQTKEELPIRRVYISVDGKVRRLDLNVYLSTYGMLRARLQRRWERFEWMRSLLFQCT